MFLMDSVNAGRRNTRTALAFLKSLVNEFDIDNDNIHVGLMSAECISNTEGFSLGSHSSRANIEQSIDQMKGTDFHDIIKQMRRKAFRTSKGARKHAKKIAILIIDGELEEPLKTLNEARIAKVHGVEVYVIQVNLYDVVKPGTVTAVICVILKSISVGPHFHKTSQIENVVCHQNY